MTAAEPFAKMVSEYDAPREQVATRTRDDVLRYREKISRLEAQLRMKNKLLSKLTAENEKLLVQVAEKLLAQLAAAPPAPRAFWRRFWPGGKR